MKKTYLTILALCVASAATAQRLDYGLDFKVRFDNREYKSEFSGDKTLFGLKLVPEAGVRWGDNRLMAGMDLTRHFGAKGDGQPDPELLLYYEYNNNRNFEAVAGIFQRDKMGSYPRAFISGSKVFYDAAIEGALFRYYGRRGGAELACDWNSMITETEYERFLLYFSGFLRFGDFTVGHYAMMHHFAGSETDPGVVDNALQYSYAGYSFSLDRVAVKNSGRTSQVKGTAPKNSYIRAGWLYASQNDRENEDKFVRPDGFMAEVQLQWRSFGVNNTIYLGDNLMPYYGRYGSELYVGDPFFRTTHGVYDRLEVYWKPRLNHGLHLKVSTVHHYDGDIWNWQQAITFSVDLHRK